MAGECADMLAATDGKTGAVLISNPDPTARPVFDPQILGVPKEITGTCLAASDFACKITRAINDRPYNVIR